MNGAGGDENGVAFALENKFAFYVVFFEHFSKNRIKRKSGTKISHLSSFVASLFFAA